MLSEEVKYWWENTLQSLEAASIPITWDNFKKEFWDKTFPERCL